MSMGGVDGGTPADLKSGAQGTIMDVIFSNYASGDDLLKVRASYTTNCTVVKKDAWLNLTDGMSNTPLAVTNSSFIGVKVYTGSQNDDKTEDCSVSTDDQTAAENAAMPSSSAAGADKSVFIAWTAASLGGLLD